MTREEKLKDIKEHPENHRHSFAGMIECCTLESGELDLSLIDAHPPVGKNGGVNCDVIEGPCSCGAWH